MTLVQIGWPLLADICLSAQLRDRPQRLLAVLQFSLLLTFDLPATVTTVGTADTVTGLNKPS